MNKYTLKMFDPPKKDSFLIYLKKNDYYEKNLEKIRYLRNFMQSSLHYRYQFSRIHSDKDKKPYFWVTKLESEQVSVIFQNLEKQMKEFNSWMNSLEGTNKKRIMLRVGIDMGYQREGKRLGALGPIFPDNRFEYIPIPEDAQSTEKMTYRTKRGRLGYPLSNYLPHEELYDLKLHNDPDFKARTYGDPTSPKRWILTHLSKNDWVVFFVGLTPWKNVSQRQNSYNQDHLFIIGYFVLKENPIDFNKLPRNQLDQIIQTIDNTHMKRINPDFSNLIIIRGKKRSRLLKNAIKLSENKKSQKQYPRIIEKQLANALSIPRINITRSGTPIIIHSRKGRIYLRKLLRNAK
ncbi:MAG: hypothetical protein ACFFBD_24155 [Candidatus Hodarchaeota archaeon]